MTKKHSYEKIFVLLCVCLSISHLSYGSEDSINEINDELLASLTLRETIAQLCVVAVAADEKRDQEVMDVWYNWQPLYHIDAQYVLRVTNSHRLGLRQSPGVERS